MCASTRRSPDRGGVGIDVVAIRIQATCTEITRAAVDVERHHHPVPRLHVAHGRPDFVHHPDEFVTEGHAHPSVGHHTVVQMQIRPADRRPLYPHNRIVRMLDARNILFFYPDLVRSSVYHRFQHASQAGVHLILGRVPAPTSPEAGFRPPNSPNRRHLTARTPESPDKPRKQQPKWAPNNNPATSPIARRSPPAIGPKSPAHSPLNNPYNDGGQSASNGLTNRREHPHRSSPLAEHAPTSDENHWTTTLYGRAGPALPHSVDP